MSEKYFQIYRSASPEGGYLGKGCLFLVDRPGSLSELAGMFADYGINIIFFQYNRSEHPNRVLIEVSSKSEEALSLISSVLSRSHLLGGQFPIPKLELGVMDTRNILKIEVQLQHLPGTLGRFARLLSEHKANVIYMAYHEDVSETSAHFSIATQKPGEIDSLLKEMNERGYYYSLVYRGAEQREIEDIIGLNLIERFFFHLRKLLDTDDIENLRRIVQSSQRLSDSLIRFSREAGKHFNTGDITTSILAFASASLMKTGKKFFYRTLPPLVFDRIKFHAFRLPTGGNINVLESDEELVMIDSGYGLYYEDAKTMFRENGLDPEKVGRIYLSHADADHAGMSGYFADELGSRVYLHAEARGVLEHENRAWGSNTPLLELNHCFTALVNEFTKFRVPKNWVPYSSSVTEWIDGFPVIDQFELSGQSYKVLGSRGGHTPGQVFFLSYDSGLIFTGDYLLFVDSLSPGEREILNLPKFMMTSTNVDSELFRREMEMMKKLIVNFDAFLRKSDQKATIVPGHGDYYSHDRFLQD
jgi:glyoxylase-like metal-dependent hydrolase (beta-lactamase superfamily II)